MSVDGATTIARARAYPQLRALVEGRQAIGRLELEGVTVPQSAIGAAVGGEDARRRLQRRAHLRQGAASSPGRWRCRCWRPRRGSAPDGAVASVTLSGPESLSARLTPTANGEIEFDVTAASLTVPFAPEVTLSSFAMKGSANRQGMNIASWGGGVLDGALSGTANMRWGDTWRSKAC